MKYWRSTVFCAHWFQSSTSELFNARSSQSGHCVDFSICIMILALLCWIAAVRRSPWCASALWLAETEVMLSASCSHSQDRREGSWKRGREIIIITQGEKTSLSPFSSSGRDVYTQHVCRNRSSCCYQLVTASSKRLQTALGGWSAPCESLTFTLREHWAGSLKSHEYARQRPREHAELPGKVPFKYLMHGALLDTRRGGTEQAVHNL